MPFVDDNFIDEVRSRNDIVDVISGYMRLTKKGTNYFGLCPFHGEKTASFSVSPRKQMFYCFGCGVGGDVFRFVREYENLSFPEVLKILAERAGMEVPEMEYSEENKRAADKKARLLEINKVAATYYYKQLKSQSGQLGLNYFRKRQLSDETITKFGLGYSLQTSDDLYQYLKSQGYEDRELVDSGLVTIDERRGAHDKFWNRVMFPIMDVNNRVIGFGGRVMGDGEPKYLNSPETAIFDKSKNLYGLQLARKSRKGALILCEGYMDVISMHQAGFNQAVASLGTALTPGHARLLKRYTNDVLLCYDSDGAGTKAALRAIPILKEAGISAKVIRMYPYKDPDEFIKNLGAEAFEERIRDAKNSFLFEIEMLRKNYDVNDPESETKFQKELVERLVAFTDELERDNYIRAVSREYNISYDKLVSTVNRKGNISGGIVEKPRETHFSPEQRKTSKEDGSSKSQRLLLTWLVEDEKLYRTVKKYISPSDFEGEIFQKVAEAIYAQLDAGQLHPEKIVGMFGEDEEELIASMFHGGLRSEEELSKEDREKALKETIVRMKKRSIDEKAANMNPGDMKAMMEIIEARRALEKIEKTQITIE